MTTILVIDDEAATRRVVMHALKSVQIAADGAEDGASALALARENYYDLLLVDINLPDIDGFTLIGHLKAIPHHASTPVVVFTARNVADDALRATEVGAVGFLNKPFSTQELRDLIQSHLA